MDHQPQSYRLKVSGLEGLQDSGQTEGIKIDSGAVADLRLLIQIDPIYLKSASSEILFHI